MRESRVGLRDQVEVVVVMQQHCLMSDGRGGKNQVCDPWPAMMPPPNKRRLKRAG